MEHVHKTIEFLEEEIAEEQWLVDQLCKLAGVPARYFNVDELDEAGDEEMEPRNEEREKSQWTEKSATIGRPRDTEKDEQIRQLLRSGAGVGEIASELGVHRNTVSRLKQRLADELEGPVDDQPVVEEPVADDETDLEPADDWGCVAVKPKLVEALTGKPDGLDVDELVKLTALDRKRVQAGLTNHRGKTFQRDDNGVWTLIPKFEATKPAAPPKSAQADTVYKYVKKAQPRSLDEIAKATGIPAAEACKILQGDQFERDADGLFWTSL